MQAARHTAATMHRPVRGGKPLVRLTYGFPKFYRRHAQPKPKCAKRIAQLPHIVRRLSSPSHDVTWDHRSAAASLRPVDQTVISKVPECKRAVPSNHSVVSIGTTAYLAEDHERKNADDHATLICANWKARQGASYWAQPGPLWQQVAQWLSTPSSCLLVVLFVSLLAGSVANLQPDANNEHRALARIP